MTKLVSNTPKTGFVQIPVPINAWLQGLQRRRAPIEPLPPEPPHPTASGTAPAPLDPEAPLSGPHTIEDEALGEALLRDELEIVPIEDGHTTALVPDGYDRDQTIARSYFYVSFTRVRDGGREYDNLIVDVHPLLWQAHHERRGGLPLTVVFWAALPASVIVAARELGIPFASLPIQVIG